MLAGSTFQRPALANSSRACPAKRIEGSARRWSAGFGGTACVTGGRGVDGPANSGSNARMRGAVVDGASALVALSAPICVDDGR
ncbi:MAG: hypothetical protein V2J14_10645, partial [Erythrobacter sp.]|nr:hypothetical protein [Erythrobacter sp.]